MTPEPTAPVRMTRQRRALDAILETTDGFLSAQDLHVRLRSGGDRVALATVYSQLAKMAEAGEVDQIRTEAGEALYRRCRSEHHHHLRCRSCGLVEELDAPAVEAWAGEVARTSGWDEIAHSVEVTGICPSCQRG